MGLLTYGRVYKNLAGFALKRNGTNNVLRTFDHIVTKARFSLTIGHCSKQLGSGCAASPPAGPGQIPGWGLRTKSLEDLQFGAINGTKIRHKIHSPAQFCC